jgi:phage-related protein
MASFPKLRTGAVAQYPAERQTRFSTRVVEFVDGREQRFPEFGRRLRRWVIRLDYLNATELAEVATFFDQAGGAASFRFVDPWDGSEHSNCVVENAEFAAESLSESRNRTEVIIREDSAPWSSFHS